MQPVPSESKTLKHFIISSAVSTWYIARQCGWIRGRVTHEPFAYCTSLERALAIISKNSPKSISPRIPSMGVTQPAALLYKSVGAQTHLIRRHRLPGSFPLARSWMGSGRATSSPGSNSERRREKAHRDSSLALAHAARLNRLGVGEEDGAIW